MIWMMSRSLLAVVVICSLPTVCGFGSFTAVQPRRPSPCSSGDDGRRNNVVTILMGQESQVDTSSSSQLTEKQLDFALGYLNKHHSDLLMDFALAFSEVGVEHAKANAWSRGAYSIEGSKIVGLDRKELKLNVSIRKERNAEEPTTELVTVNLGKSRNLSSLDLFSQKYEFSWTDNFYCLISITDADPIEERKRSYDSRPIIPSYENVSAIDDIVRRLCRLCWIVKKPEVTGKLLMLGIQLDGAGIGKIPENMYLNQGKQQ